MKLFPTVEINNLKSFLDSLNTFPAAALIDSPGSESSFIFIYNSPSLYSFFLSHLFL